MECKSIEVSISTYERLSKLVKGFSDTPNTVISRLLDKCEHLDIEKEKSVKKPEIVFFPTNEEKFKEELLVEQIAEITLYKNDGSREVKTWDAKRLTKSSNIRANLWSGQLRSWEKKGIVKAELCLYEYPSNPRDRGLYQLCRLASPLLNIPNNELLESGLEYEVEGEGITQKINIKFPESFDINELKNTEKWRVSIPTKTVTVSAVEIGFTV